LLDISKLPANVCQLDNGLTVIHQEIPATPVAVVDVWVRAGAAVDPIDAPGMAHFLEHMIFKGTARVGPGMFDRAIESRGGVSNAVTSHDFAHYFMIAAVEHLEETLPYLAELLLHPAIPDDEFVREREVVMEEIRQSEDDPDWLGFQALMETVYPQHPYGRPVLGTQVQLMEQTPAQMHRFHQCYYQPENMTVVVVGGISQDRAKELVSQNFHRFRKRSQCPIQDRLYRLASSAPEIAGIERRSLSLPRLEQARLMMAWTGPGVEKLSNAHGLDLLSVLLAAGRSSRLVRQLREESELVQGILSDFSLQRDSSLFTITAWLEPQYLEYVETLISEAIGELQNTPVSDGEISRCKRQLCNDYAFSTETPGQLAGLYGYYNTIASAEQSVTYPASIQALQAEDLQRLANSYLSVDKYAVTTLRPLW